MRAVLETVDSGPVISWPLLVISVLFLVAGGLAYAGRWTSWAAGWATKYIILGLAWFGAAGVAIFLAYPLSTLDSPVAKAAAGALGLVALVAFAVAALSPWWMWSRLQPRWLRDWLAAGRPVVPRTRRGRW
ncbi:MAG: hypothetical protein QG671_4568 [Actinomycetota bacterium]|nr:hypothetical protein [Actinomycetota bacterium]